MKTMEKKGVRSVSGWNFSQNRSQRCPAMEASPHLRTPSPTSQRVMADVLAALVPAVLGSVYLFGPTVIPIYLLSVATALVVSVLFQFLRKRPLVPDLSAAVTGILFAMSMPATVPLWFAVLGPAFGIVVGKELFGGIGRNFLNPALTGRALLRVVFANQVLQNPVPNPPFNMLQPVDGVAGSTTLMFAKEGQHLTSSKLWDAFLGTVPGKLGETSAVLLLIGAVYLLARGVIKLRLPLAMLGTIAAIAFVFGGPAGLFSADYSIVLGHVLGGASILGAFYMITDYSSSPSAPAAQVVYGMLVGIAVMLWRLYSPYSEGFTFAVLMVNLLVPLLNRYVRPRVLGERRGKLKAG